MAARVDLARLPTRPHLKLETALWKEGIEFIAGIDEAGRGSFFGSVELSLEPWTVIGGISGFDD